MEQRMAIALTYRHNDPDDFTPAFSDLTSWDQELFDDYDAKLTEIMPDFGLDPTDAGLKLTLIAFAQLSKGHVRPKIRAACRFHNRLVTIGYLPAP